MEVYIFYLCALILLSMPPVACTHNVEHITNAKISIAYMNEKGTETELDKTSEGIYGMNSRVNTSPVKGQLVRVHTDFNKSELGCSSLDEKLIPETGPWIALVKRGICNFNEKIHYAKLLKASAVVIYDNKSVPNDSRSRMKMDTKGDFDGMYVQSYSKRSELNRSCLGGTVTATFSFLNPAFIWVSLEVGQVDLCFP